jgi:hypothetical protein
MAWLLEDTNLILIPETAMSYLLMGIAGLWMADGIALLIAPLQMIALLKETLIASPSLIRWSMLSAIFGVILLLQVGELPYHPLWLFTGMAMIAKGLFFQLASNDHRRLVIKWGLTREAVDYRFWGLALCTLSMLLLDSVGAFRAQ